VRQGVSLDQFALNIDFAPTIAELANATPGRAMDGRTLTPLLVRDTPPSNNWRKDFLVEFYRAPGQPGSPGKVLRTRHEVYVEYADGFRELYDLRTDPYQLDNVFSTADKGHVKNLSERLAELVAPGVESPRHANSPAPASAGIDINKARAIPVFASTVMIRNMGAAEPVNTSPNITLFLKDALEPPKED
jgi:arylsulfatase A-like enzyme